MSRRRAGRAWWGLGLGLGLLAAVVVGLILVLGPGGHPRRPRPPAPTPLAPRPARPAAGGTAYGAAVNDLFNDGPRPTSAVRGALGALRATGATLARADALWEATEPTPPEDGRKTWNWSFDDGIATALARAGLRWLPILDYSPAWAQSVPGQDHSPPRSDAAYAAYARGFAARYGPGGAFWADHPRLPREPVDTIEIWNEPDSAQFWVPAPDPAAYGALYASARTAIDAVAPQIRVIVGGLTQPTTFLPALLQADPGLAGRIDGVAIHPYGRPDRVLARVRAARATLRAIGQGAVPLYVTEFGWTRAPAGSPAYAPAARRPGYLRRTLGALAAAARSCGLSAVVVYAWDTPQHDPGDAGEWYGIHGAGDGATQAAFAAALRAGGRGHHAAALSGCSS